MKSKILFNALFSITLILTNFFMFTRTSQGQGSGEVINLGLYGGAAIDLTYCNANQRLFAGVTTPGSVFFTDDACVTWTRPFPTDSLEFASGQRGWGGGGRRILSNQEGWVAVRTAQSGGTLTAAVISYSEGDSGSFQTAMDRVLLQQINPAFNAQSVTGIGLSDHYLYIGMERYLLRLNDTTTSGLHNVVTRTDTISGISSGFIIRDMAVANHSSGYPVYLLLSTSVHDGGKIYKFDGTTFTLVSLFPAYPFPHTVDAVFTHPGQTTGDTLIASIRDTFAGTRFVFLSTNGGSIWTDITPAAGTNWPLHSADYSPSWTSVMPSSNGLRLSFPGGGVSDNLGTTWSNHVLPDNAMATHPTNTMHVTGAYGRGVAVSTTGPNGPFVIANNEGLSAVSISKIANKPGVFYVATNAGLGYTTAYKSTTITGIAKWQAPYGQFPVNNVGDDGGASAIAISPTNPQHVIAGYSGGFAVTTTGHTGFTNLTPTGWNTSTNYDARVNDIEFVTDQIVVAVSGAGSNVLQFPLTPYGNIWRSADGGSTWSIVTPSGFEQGNTVEVGYAGGDTVLFAGCGYFDMSYPKVDGQLWRSDDLGLNWTLVNGGPTGQGSATLNMPIYDIDIHPHSNDTLFLASGENLDYAFTKSTDGGVTYSYISLMPHGAFSSVLIDSLNPDVVSAAARRNLFRHNTVTGTTMITFNGLPGEFVPDLEYGSTLLGTTTGLYQLIENMGEDTTYWNGEGNWDSPEFWSDGTPEYQKNVFIQSGSSNINGTYEMNELIVEPLAALSLLNSGAISLNSILHLKSDITGTASYINEKTGSNTQYAHVETYLTDGRWHYVSAPVQQATAEAFFFAEGSDTWLKEFDEEINDWVYIENLDHPLVTGKGYAVWLSNTRAAETAVYEGHLNKGDKTVNLGYHAETGQGWNMVGNPFPSALDWDEGDWNHVNTTGIAYVWNNGNYVTRNLFGSGTLTDGIIPSAQGFFVKATDAGASVTMPESARVHASQAFYKNNNNYLNSLDVTVGSGEKTDKTWIGFDADATAEIDLGRDAVRLNGSMDMPRLFTRAENTNMSINILPDLIENFSLPLYFTAHEISNFELSFDLIESFNLTYLTLVDHLSNTDHDLLLNPVYAFLGNPSDDEHRFTINFGLNPSSVDEEVHTDAFPIVYQDGNEMVIELTNWASHNAKVEIYDLQGRMHAEHFTGEGQIRLNTEKFRNNLVMVRISGADEVFVTKAFIR